MSTTTGEFLRIIAQCGVATWNRWVLSHPGIGIDLSWQDLSGLNLDEIVLEEACLIGTNFFKTSLKNARMRCAEASKAIFVLSDLRNVDIRFAIIHDADFRAARLEGSNIHLAIENRNTLFGWNE